jgi:hypothetical protein
VNAIPELFSHSRETPDGETIDYLLMPTVPLDDFGFAYSAFMEAKHPRYKGKWIEKHEGWKNTLSNKELGAVKDYVSSDVSSERIKKNERGEPDLPFWKDEAKYFNSGLDKAPIYEGVTYRGARRLREESFKAYTAVGSEFEFTSSQSSSLRKDEGEEFSNGYFMFVIDGKTGRDIQDVSIYDEEKEIIVRKNSRFKVIKVEHDVPITSYQPGFKTIKTVVHIKEI